MSIPPGPDQVSVPWIRQVLADAGDPRAEETSAVRAERIGVGYGLDGTLARLTFTGPGVKEWTLVAKWCRSEIGAREARFYRELGPSLGLDLPRLHAAVVDADRALLLLEDLWPSRQGDALVGATDIEAQRVVDVAGRFHARFWGAADDARVAWLPRWGRDPAGEAERTRVRLPAFLERWGPTLGPGVRAAAERLPEDLIAAHARLAQAPLTVLHGDLHLDNVLFRPDGAPVVIDWPTCALGPASVDVVRILSEALTVDSRRRLERSLVDRHAQALLRHGIDYGAAELWASMDDAYTHLFAASIRSKDPTAEPIVPRLAPIIDNLVLNVTAAIQDRMTSTHTPRPAHPA